MINVIKNNKCIFFDQQRSKYENNIGDCQTVFTISYNLLDKQFLNTGLYSLLEASFTKKGQTNKSA